MINSYSKIFNFGHREVRDIFEEDVLIEEKVDGSQFSFGIVDGELCCRSRSKQIVLDAPEKLFVEGVEAIKRVKHLLTPGWIYRGEYLCLSGDTVVKKASGGKSSKYVTIKSLFELQETGIAHRQYTRKDTGETVQYRTRSRWETDGKPKLYSLDIKKDKIVQNKFKKIIFCGTKTTFTVITRKGASIKATAQHPFWTPYGWIALKDLKINDCVGLLDSTHYKVQKRLYGSSTKQIQELFKKLKTDNKCANCGLDVCLEIHHIDGNPHNNNVENLQVLCRDCHNIEPKKSQRTDQDYEFDKIVSITENEPEECYDIEMEGDENVASFVANDFIVHNCKPKHNVLAYDKTPDGHIIIFDISTGDQEYLPYDEKVSEASKLGFQTVPVLFYGMVQSLEHLMCFLDKESILGGAKIEGFVIKNYARYGADKKVLMAKHVSEKFKEVHRKTFKSNNPNQGDILTRLKETYRTEARWQKAIQHLQEAGVLENSPRDIGKLIKEVQADVMEECKEEIKQALWKWAWPKINRAIIAGLPEWYKELLLKSQFEETDDDPGPAEILD